MEHFSDLDMYYLGQGTHYDVYRKLGAHPAKKKGKAGVYFAVLAPNAVKVSVIGTFNDWKEDANEMERLSEICTNFISRRRTAESFTRRIPMQIMRRCVPERRQR